MISIQKPNAESSPAKRVVVTGMGMLSPVGMTTESVSDVLRAATLPSDVPSSTVLPRAGFLGVLDGWEPESLKRTSRQRTSAASQYALVATLHALEQAGFTEELIAQSPTAVFVGTMMGGMQEVVRIRQLLDIGKMRRAGGMGTTKLMNSAAAVNIAAYFGLQGPAFSISSGFGSGLENIGCGYEWIRDGYGEMAICGGTEELCSEFLGPQFSAWESATSSLDENIAITPRPFDASRTGTVMSAGSGILLLESAEHAAARGATPIADVVGFSAEFDGEGACDQFQQALTNCLRDVSSQLTAREIPCRQVISGAAGFRLADAQHAAAIRDAFGSDAVVTSTSGLLGHSLGASSGWNAVVAALMVSQGFLPPNHGLKDVAEDCRGLQLLTEQRELSEPAVIVAAGGLGFGSCLAISRPEDAVKS